MIKDFQTYISEGLFDRNQSEFSIRKTDKGIEEVYIPRTKGELDNYIELDIKQAKRDGTYPNVNLNNIDISKLENDDLKGLFGIYRNINPDISNWNIKYIPSKFFRGNEQIKEFNIPNSVTSIGDGAFNGCNSLTFITIPNSVTSIGNWTFGYCSSLTSVDIPNGVTSIEEAAFYTCSGLTSVTIGNSVTSIGNWAFGYCGSLTSVEIPDSVTSIENYAFCECRKLTSAIIPNSVTSIGDGVFRNCKVLTSVNISKLCHIGANSFPKNCKIIRRND